jgi:hypothetical protein
MLKEYELIDCYESAKLPVYLPKKKVEAQKESRGSTSYSESPFGLFVQPFQGLNVVSVAYSRVSRTRRGLPFNLRLTVQCKADRSTHFKHLPHLSAMVDA